MEMLPTLQKIDINIISAKFTLSTTGCNIPRQISETAIEILNDV
jgi:hypothetical protein